MRSQQPIEADMPVDLDGVSAPRLTVPMVAELAREIEQARLEANLSIDELLKNLREQRERYYREQHAASQSE